MHTHKLEEIFVNSHTCLCTVQFMVAVKFYLFIGIVSWAIFNLVIVQQNMKNQRKPEKPQINFTKENDEKLTKVRTNGHVTLHTEG